MKTINLELIDNHICVLTLNRPEAANALSAQLLSDLNKAVDKIIDSNEVRVLIITGSGNKAFCAGADLKEREGMDDEDVIHAVRNIKDTITRIDNLSIPTIAAINGAAFGGGLELALACDIRFASEKAKMGLTETSLAIIPGAGGTQRLSRLIGPGKAKYLIMTAKRLTSQEAKGFGIVEEVFNENSFMKEVFEIARLIAGNGPIGVQQAKRAIQLGFEKDLKTALDIEEECYKKTIPTEDRKEGLIAFKEKRKPHYKGL